MHHRCVRVVPYRWRDGGGCAVIGFSGVLDRPVPARHAAVPIRHAVRQGPGPAHPIPADAGRSLRLHAEPPQFTREVNRAGFPGNCIQAASGGS